MSIKSQKSLNDECSEIFEKSYSVRSASEESLSCSDEEECLARELINKMTPAVLSKLRRCFKKSKAKNNAQDIDRRVEEVMRAAAAEEGIEFAAPAQLPPQSLCLNEPAFVAAIESIFGDRKYSPHARQLFQSLDPFSSGRVWWRQLLERLVAAGAARRQRGPPPTEGGVVRMHHCKRETIVKLVSIEREESFCYAAVTKGGRVGVYSGLLKLLNSYEVFYHRSGVRRRVKNCWITDAIYLSDVQSLVLAASDRSLTVYDVTTLTHTPLYCVTGLPNIPTCLAYQPAKQPGGSSELMFGTERGDITRLRFLQPRVTLFHTTTPDNINYYFWMELTSPPHTSYCSISTWRRVHSRSVRRVYIARDGDIVLSCSHDSVASVRARHLPGKLDDYVLRVQRGVRCFHAVWSLPVVACGGAEGAVRLWDAVQRAPFARLTAPSTSAAQAVLDVAVVAAQEIVVAYCSNCVIHIWDLYEECLLQTVKIKFPFLGVLGKRVEFGTYCIHPGPPRTELSEGPADEGPPTESRRGSSVQLAASGGLLLQQDLPPAGGRRALEQDPEYIRFNRSELLVTCCDYVFTLVLRTPRGAAPAAPGDTLRARRPSHWDLPETLMAPSQPAVLTPRPSPTAATPQPAPDTDEQPHIDIEELLASAGLQGILEKDFVLMQALKHDLNKKIFEMESNMEATRLAVSAGAPHLALRSAELAPLHPPPALPAPRARLARLFPGRSVSSLSGSDTTPRHDTTDRLS